MSGSLRTRLTTRTRQVRQTEDWSELVGTDWPDWIMDTEATDDFHSKQGRSTCRWLPEGVATESVYLKRHFRLPRWLGILATLFPNGNWSPGFGEWHHLCHGQQLGIRVPRPRAAVQYIGPWGKLQSVLVIDELRGMLPLHQAIPLAAESLSPKAFAYFKRALTRELARMSRLLHGQSVFHKDLYLCHFFLEKADIETWEQRPRSQRQLTERLVLIDFHRLGRHRLSHVWWQIKDLAQLWYSSELEQISDRDRLRYWRYYCGSKRGWWYRLLRGFVWLKWQRYRDHNLKKKRREQVQEAETRKAA